MIYTSSIACQCWSNCVLLLRCSVARNSSVYSVLTRDQSLDLPPEFQIPHACGIFAMD